MVDRVVGTHCVNVSHLSSIPWSNLGICLQVVHEKVGFIVASMRFVPGYHRSDFTKLLIPPTFRKKHRLSILRFKISLNNHHLEYSYKSEA